MDFPCAIGPKNGRLDGHARYGTASLEVKTLICEKHILARCIRAPDAAYRRFAVRAWYPDVSSMLTYSHPRRHIAPSDYRDATEDRRYLKPSETPYVGH